MNGRNFNSTSRSNPGQTLWRRDDQRIESRKQEGDDDIWSSLSRLNVSPEASTSHQQPPKPYRAPIPSQPAPRTHPRSFHPPQHARTPLPPHAKPNQTSSLGSPASDLKPMNPSQKFKKMDEMELVGTLSRSGGSGDDRAEGLLDLQVQGRYWVWIQGKLEEFYTKFPTFRTDENGDPDPTLFLYPQFQLDPKQTEREKEGKEHLNTILLQLRKLREGILATRRSDDLAIQVYELSTLLALRAENHAQLSSSLGVLVGGLYDRCSSLPIETLPDSTHKAQEQKRERELVNGRRGLFISLSLVYAIAHRESGLDFWTGYFRCTKTHPGVTSSRTSNPNPINEPPDRGKVLDRTDPHLQTAMRFYTALTSPDPVLFHTLLRSPRVHPALRRMGRFAWGSGYGERVWDWLRVGWRGGVGVGFAGKVLGVELSGMDREKREAQDEEEDEWARTLKRDEGRGEEVLGSVVKGFGGRMEGRMVLFK